MSTQHFQSEITDKSTCRSERQNSSEEIQIVIVNYSIDDCKQIIVTNLVDAS